MGFAAETDRDQAALPCIGESDEGGVGEKLHLEDKPDSLPVLTLLGIPGGSVAGTDQGSVSPAPSSTLGGDESLLGINQVGEQGAVRVTHHCPHGHS